MSEVILSVENIAGGYLPGISVLHGISVSVMQGEAVGILGLNGSGKSSFGRAVVNLLPYRQGRVILKGEDVSDRSTEELSRSGLRMMFQGGQVFKTLSVWDNLRLVMDSDFRQRMEMLRPVIPILGRKDSWLKGTMADKLSGGERHQLALALTLASLPETVILDEPSAGLSPKSVEVMYSLLEEVRIRFNLTILLIEQNISKAVNYCDRCLLIRQGMVDRSFARGELDAIEQVMFNSKK